MVRSEILTFFFLTSQKHSHRFGSGINPSTKQIFFKLPYKTQSHNECSVYPLNPVLE